MHTHTCIHSTWDFMFVEHIKFRPRAPSLCSLVQSGFPLLDLVKFCTAMTSWNVVVKKYFWLTAKPAHSTQAHSHTPPHPHIYICFRITAHASAHTSTLVSVTSANGTNITHAAEQLQVKCALSMLTCERDECAAHPLRSAHSTHHRPHSRQHSTHKVSHNKTLCCWNFAAHGEHAALTNCMFHCN